MTAALASLYAYALTARDLQLHAMTGPADHELIMDGEGKVKAEGEIAHPGPATPVTPSQSSGDVVERPTSRGRLPLGGER